MDRWTMEQMQNTDDITFAIAILNERRSKLTRYSPLALKLQEAESTLHEIHDAALRFLEEASAKAEPTGGQVRGQMVIPWDTDADVSQMTEEEYQGFTREMSRRALMQIIAKVERPDGDPLTAILTRAVDELEALQEVEVEIECPEDAGVTEP